ncbi:hypothetical protein ACYBQU_00015 [Klebsiella pneumoniae]|uniref:hypothetical protein n=1 Tax=Klebsiella pneumoniae TaxID=573 RepID=UPI00143853CD|nr:hypothetical protein [Klebsiella pneumoniae]MDM8026331.1 hypothetical protein [Klebsiella pneumoniae]MDM8031715.1 hypothetical protein [Klebsiella pneumoniae]MDM8037187.1 hypothetical protein [Klebsiella pneumoniae]MDM8052708.1 hypothetical protein [Klebsiella pneumoniae]MDM8069077.1 hypothetical protein [Klebsiella pneumoniae]
MSLRLPTILPGTGYKHISEFVVDDIFADLPNKAGLVGAYFLSSQVGSALVNYADLNKPLLKVGAPAVGSKYATTGTANFYDTQLPSTPVMTVLGISLPGADSQNGVLLANYSQSPISGDTLQYYLGHARAFGQMGSSIASADTVVPTTDLPSGVLAVTGGVIKNASVKSIAYDPTTDALVSSTASSAGRTVTTDRTLRIGTSYATTQFTGGSSVSVVLVYNVELTDTQILANAQWLKNSFGVEWGLW